MQAISLVVAFFLLVGNFFFVAVEFSVTKTRPTMVIDLVERKAPGAKSLQHAVRHIDAYLSACQLGITVCSIGLGVTAEPVVSEALSAAFGEGRFLGISATVLGFVLGYAIVSVFHVVLGELAPKSLAIARTERIGLLLAPPMRGFYLIAKPAVDALNWMGNMVLKPFGIPPASEADEQPHSEPELQMLIGQSEEKGILAPEEKAFAEGVFTFGDRRAREVMVPRARVEVLYADQSFRDAASVAAHSGHDRLPLCPRGSGLEEASGMVRTLSLLGALTAESPDTSTLSEVSTPLLRTSELVLLDELLADMRRRRLHMALLTDEFGTAVGVVTLEDVLEQIVGDIRDETDHDDAQSIEHLSDGALRVAGSAPLDSVRHELGLKLEEHRQVTFGGYVIELLGRIPERGEELSVDGWNAVVEETSEASVDTVTMRPATKP